MKKTTVSRVMFLGLFIFLVAQGKMMLWLALFGVSLVATVFWGRLYCGYACPMNTVIQPIEKISQKLNIQKSVYPKRINANIVGGIMVVLSIAGIVITKRVLGQNIPLMIIWIGIAMLITLRYKQAFFHNYICPFGWLQKRVAKFSRRSKTVSEEACSGCSLCEKDCPTNAIKVSKNNKKANINKELCFQCESCQENCPKDIIVYQ